MAARDTNIRKCKEAPDANGDITLPEPVSNLVQSTSKVAAHLVVLVHGHTSSEGALELLRNELESHAPSSVRFLMSSAASTWKTHRSLERKGRLKIDDLDYAALCLSKEVATAVHEMSKGLSGRVGISFVACGTGGLIVRAALPWMPEHRNDFRTCITLGTPHLGLWWQTASWYAWLRLFILRLTLGFPLFLDQLRLSERRWSQGSTLHRLSSDAGLDCFRHVIFVASPEDAVVSLTSALACAPGQLQAQTVTEPKPFVATQLVGSNKGALYVLMPLMWLMRLRAWWSLAALLVSFLLMLFMPTPQGRVGQRIRAVKDAAADLQKIVTDRENADLDAMMTQAIEASIKKEQLMRVELPRVCRSWKGPDLMRGFGSEVVENPQVVKALALAYGPLLS